MLKLKIAMDELNITQKALVLASGVSKTQISLTLNKGTLPADQTKLRAGVDRLLELYPDLQFWLNEREETVEDLLTPVPQASANTMTAAEQALCELAGRAVLMDAVPGNLALRLARTTGYLLGETRRLAGYQREMIDNEVFRLLTGDTA